LRGHTGGAIQTTLQETFQGRLSVDGTAERGNREKAISILLKIWVTVPRELMLFRDDGLTHLNRLPLTDYPAVHWGMTIAVYPFVGVVAEAVGRLLRLQGSCAAVQVQRRVREQLGERETVARAARRILRCFIDWGVLQETQEKGVSHAVPVRSVADKKLAAWLVEAALLVNGSNAGPLKAVTQTPMLFPLSIGPLGMGDLKGYDRLEWFRQGLDEEMVMLRSSGAFR
jgi:hypothetical protein